MSNNKNKRLDYHLKDTVTLEAEAQEELNSRVEDSMNETPKIHTHVNPLGMRVLVKIPNESFRTGAGLFIPENAKDSMSESIVADVIEVASAMDDDSHEETNISGIPLGAKVLINKKVGTQVPWDSSLRIVETKDVLAVVEEINLT